MTSSAAFSLLSFCFIFRSFTPAYALVIDDADILPPVQSVRVDTTADFIYFVRYSPDGKLIFAGGQNMAALWNSDTKTLAAALKGHRAYVFSGSFSFDGQRIVTASADNTAKIWKLDGSLVLTLAGHRGTVNDAGFSPKGDQIVTASTDQTAEIWDASTGRRKQTLTGHRGWVKSAEFSSDGSRILTAGDDGARLWNAQTGALVKFIPNEKGNSSARFSRDGKTAVTAGADHVSRILDSATGGILATLTGHTSTIECAVYNSDGKLIVTSSPWDRTIRIWDARQGTQIAQWTPTFERSLYSCAFSPDGQELAVGADKKLLIWTWAAEKHRAKEPQRNLTFPARPLGPGDRSPAEELFRIPWDRAYLGTRF